jgi:uncharacterized protein YkwD
MRIEMTKDLFCGSPSCGRKFAATVLACLCLIAGPVVAAAQALYSVGDPTDEEQLYLEYINRARVNPAAEALRLQSTSDPDLLQAYAGLSVDLDMMVSQLSSLAAAPPLAMNAELLIAARLHSQDMLTNAFEGHLGSDGSTVDARLQAQGYAGDGLGENIFSYATSVEDGHGAFEVDWGEGDGTTGGMEDPPLHRLNDHNSEYQEVGIGVVDGTNGEVGPQVVTEDFGHRAGQRALITGVVYYDLDGDGFYGLGEGIGGAAVTVPGADFYSLTGRSGGYALPVPGDGTYTVTFSITNLPQTQVTVVVTNGGNVKVDDVLPYSGAVVLGTSWPKVNLPNVYTFSAVGGATGYQWKWAQPVAVTGIVENAESGLGRVTALTSPGYNVLDSIVAASGTNSFHLAHSQPASQILTLNRVFLLGAAAQLSFASELGLATTGEVARAQISLNRGRTWQDVWSQSGSERSADSAFSTQQVPLAAFAGREIMIRFRYDVVGASFYAEPDSSTGFHVDDIALTGARELIETVADAPPDNVISFLPLQPGPYSLSVRARNGDHLFDWGPNLDVVAQPAPPGQSMRVSSVQRLPNGQLEIDFTVQDLTVLPLEIQAAPSPMGPWSPESEAAIAAQAAPYSFRAILPLDQAAARFFRIARGSESSSGSPAQ